MTRPTDNRHPADAGFALRTLPGRLWPRAADRGRSASTLSTAILLLAMVAAWSGSAQLVARSRYLAPRFGTPVLAGDKLVFAERRYEAHRLICIAKEGGKKLWEISDPQQALRPWFVLSNQVIVTVGGDIQGCDPATGRLTSLYRTSYERYALLNKQPDGSLFVQGETDNVDYLACLDCRSWQVRWQRPRIALLVAVGEEALLCEEATRKPAGGGGYSLLNERWVALRRRDGKEMWSCAPFAEAAAMDRFFLGYLKDTISCLNQADGKTVKEFRIRQEPYASASLATQGQQLLVRTRQFGPDIRTFGQYTFFSLTVPELQWRKLTQAEWDSALAAQHNVRDGGCVYSASIARDWESTSINRTETKTGKWEELYREPVPAELRARPGASKGERRTGRTSQDGSPAGASTGGGAEGPEPSPSPRRQPSPPAPRTRTRRRRVLPSGPRRLSSSWPR